MRLVYLACGCVLALVLIVPAKHDADACSPWNNSWFQVLLYWNAIVWTVGIMWAAVYLAIKGI